MSNDPVITGGPSQITPISTTMPPEYLTANLRTDEHERRIGALEERLRVVWTAPITALQENVSALAQRVEAVEKTIAAEAWKDANRNTSLAKRVEACEQRLSALDDPVGHASPPAQEKPHGDAQLEALVDLVRKAGSSQKPEPASETVCLDCKHDDRCVFCWPLGDLSLLWCSLCGSIKEGNRAWRRPAYDPPARQKPPEPVRHTAQETDERHKAIWGYSLHTARDKPPEPASETAVPFEQRDCSDSADEAIWAMGANIDALAAKVDALREDLARLKPPAGDGKGA